MAMVLPFLGPIFDLIGKGLDKFVPDANQKEQIKAQLQSELMKMDWAAVEREFQDRADARALAKVDSAGGNWFTAILSATVRPVWGYCSLVVVAYPYLAGALHLPAVTIDDATKDIVQTVIIFYFGGRTLERIVPAIKGR